MRLAKWPAGSANLPIGFLLLSGGLVACSRLAPLLSVVAVGGPGALGRACALGSSRRVVVLVGVKLGLQVLGLTAESVGPCWLKIPICESAKVWTKFGLVSKGHLQNSCCHEGYQPETLRNPIRKLGVVAERVTEPPASVSVDLST